jgi:hypothetical protein
MGLPATWTSIHLPAADSAGAAFCFGLHTPPHEDGGLDRTATVFGARRTRGRGTHVASAHHERC